MAFWAQHALFEDACSFIISNKLPATVFVEDVFLVALSHAKLPLLLRAIRRIDRDLKNVGPYLLEVCKLLNNRGAVRLLLTIQELMKDYVRAALTSIKVSMATSDVGAKLKYLEQAKTFLLEGLEDLQNKRGTPASPASSSGTAQSTQSSNAVLTEPEISRYLRSLNLQVEVLKYFSTQPKNVSQLNNLSLFGQQAQKSEIARELLECANHDLAFRVMQEFRMPMAPIYAEAIAKIAGRRQVPKIFDLLKNVKGSVDDKDWDEMVLAGVRVMVRDHHDAKTGERLVDKLVYPQSKVEGFVLCGKLKSAYLVAVKAADTSLIIKIREEAFRSNVPGVAELCQKFLSTHHQ